MDIGLNLDRESVRSAGLLEPLCVEPETSLRQVIRLLKDRGRGSLLVCRQGRLAGIITERDILRLLASAADLDVPIQEAMSRQPVSLQPDDTLAEAVARMASHGYRRLPIVDSEQRPLGILKVEAIVHWLVDHFPAAVYNLPPVSKPATREREGP